MPETKTPRKLSENELAEITGFNENHRENPHTTLSERGWDRSFNEDTGSTIFSKDGFGSIEYNTFRAIDEQVRADTLSLLSHIRAVEEENAELWEYVEAMESVNIILDRGGTPTVEQIGRINNAQEMLKNRTKDSA